MEYVILGLILSGTMLYVMYARSDVEQYKSCSSDCSNRKYHTYTKGDLDMLANEVFTDEYLANIIGVSVKAINTKRRRLKS